VEKTANVFNQRYDTKSHNFVFLKKTCCDFKKLETAYWIFERTSDMIFTLERRTIRKFSAAGNNNAGSCTE